MNAPLLVTAAVCVGAPTLLAAALLYRERIRPTDQRLDQLAGDEHGEHQILDSEDHGHEPTDIEQQIIDNLRATPLEITPEMRDRAIARHAAEFPANPVAGRPATPAQFARQVAAFRRQYLDEPDPSSRERQVNARAVIETRPPLPGEDVAPAYHDFERPTPLTADELDADIAAYETAAADRFRHAGVTWPTNPASVGIARYDSKAGK